MFLLSSEISSNRSLSGGDHITHGSDAQGVDVSVEVDVLHQLLIVELVLALVREGKLHLCVQDQTQGKDKHRVIFNWPSFVQCQNEK